MQDEEGNTEEFRSDRWAKLTVSSLALAVRVSTILFIGAAFALLLGVLGSVATMSAISRAQDLGDVVSLRSESSAFVVAQSSQVLLSSLLPAGLLLAAGVAIRLQAARFETELLED